LTTMILLSIIFFQLYMTLIYNNDNRFALQHVQKSTAILVIPTIEHPVSFNIITPVRIPQKTVVKKVVDQTQRITAFLMKRVQGLSVRWHRSLTIMIDGIISNLRIAVLKVQVAVRPNNVFGSLKVNR